MALRNGSIYRTWAGTRKTNVNERSRHGAEPGQKIADVFKFSHRSRGALGDGTMSKQEGVTGKGARRLNINTISVRCKKDE